MPETNEGAVVTPEVNEGDSKPDTISISKSEFEKMNQTLGSLKRELKDYKKASESVQETPQKTESTDTSALLKKMENLALRAANVTHQDDVELARKIAKDTGKDIEDVLESGYFKYEVEALRTQRANADAVSNIKGDKGGVSSKTDPAYWLAKGQPPSPADVPDRKARAQIARAFMAGNGSGKKFYND